MLRKTIPHTITEPGGNMEKDLCEIDNPILWRVQTFDLIVSYLGLNAGTILKGTWGT